MSNSLNVFLAEYWPHLVFVLSLTASLCAAVHAAMTKQDVRAAIGWVGVVLLSPIFGVLFYLVAGINRIRRNNAGLRLTDDQLPPDPLPGNPTPPPLTTRMTSLKQLGDRVSIFRLEPGNHIYPLNGGDETYPAMLAAIRGAQQSVALSTYIFDNDGAGREIVEALAQAHARGVEVRVLIDAIGAKYSRPAITRPLTVGKVPTALFMSNVLGLRLPYANLRSHRKILVVDGTIGFTGGMNIRAGFVSALAGERMAFDTHFRITGPLVAHLMSVIAHDWEFTTKEKLSGPRWFPPSRPSAGGVLARAVPSGPDRTLGSTHMMLMGALAVAEKHVRIQSPYFLPDQQLIGAMATAALRGITVDIVIPAANNLTLVDHAMTAQLDQVVRTGCRVWRAAGSFDHSKLMTVDGLWSYVGSSNLDPRSLRLNFELDLEIHGADTAQWIEHRIDAHIATARRETAETLAQRPFAAKLRNRLIWLASPYL